MRELISQWYIVLSGLYGAVAEPLGALADNSDVPLLSALLFGLLGAASPCQLTTNAGALAYVARGAGSRGRVATSALAYLAGKLLVYTLIGLVVILAGRQIAQQSIPLVVAARKVLGPLMVLLGLALFGLVRPRLAVGFRLAGWLEARAGTGATGAFLLGVAFSLAFCPTLFLLFFGLTIPLALTSPFGVVYPGVFALGTALPLLGLAGLLSVGASVTRQYVRGARRIERRLRPLAASVLLLAGLHDTVVYWLLS